MAREVVPSDANAVADVAVDPPGRRRPLLERIGPLEGWAVTLYDACDLACTYCITGVQGTSTPRYRPDEVVDQLRKELPALPPEVRLTVGALCDAYPRAEEQHGVTRRALAELLDQGRRLQIVTKGATVLRDLDLLVGRPDVRVIVSLCSHDEVKLRRIDPGAPSAAERLEMVRRIDEAGVLVELAAAPWIPDITDAARLIELVPDHITIRFTALRAADTHVVDTPFGRRYDQATVNEAYQRARRAVPERPNVFWSRPPSIDGAPPHLAVLLGSTEKGADLTPAAPKVTVVFPHIRKTGGTSLVRTLEPHYPGSMRYPSAGSDTELTDAYENTDRLLGLSEMRRRELRFVAGHFPPAAMDLLDLPGPTLRTILVRDPVERTVSFLHHCKRHHPDCGDRSLEDLYDDPFLQCWFIHEHQTRLLSLGPDDVEPTAREQIHARPIPQPEPVGGHHLGRAVATLESFDLVGITERFDDLVARLEQRLGLRLERLAPQNSSSASEAPTDALRARIRRDHPFDAELHRHATQLATR